MTSAGDWMRRTLDLARAARGTTAPNPAVGAILVRGDRVLGEGWTQPAGGNHAEVEALARAKEAGHATEGATLYVTLEPCRHHGRTPPCTEAILAAGIARVVVGCVDPFPAMRGQGLVELQDAGVAVELSELEAACKRQCLGFARSLSAGLPEVTLKMATSLDGHIATASGQSKWITGADARAHGHRLRAHHDAILVGMGTVRADNPRLTCRAEGLQGRDPVPVVVDTHLTIADDAAVFGGPRRAIVVCVDDAPERDLPAEVVRVPADANGRVCLRRALLQLASRGLHRVLVEGGGQVHRSLLDADLVDAICAYVAGRLIPGGRPAVGGPPILDLERAIQMTLVDVERVGGDLALGYEVTHGRPDPWAGVEVPALGGLG